MKNTTQGFTLIELLIVIAIIGILAAVLIPNLLGARKRAYDTSAASCAKSIQTVQATAQIDLRRYLGFAKAANDTSVTVSDPAAPTGAALTGTALSDWNKDLNAACNAPEVVIAIAGGAGITAPTTNPSSTEYAINVKDTRGSQQYVITTTEMKNAVQ